MPLIDTNGRTKITISIFDINDVISKQDRWNGIPIEYRIDRIRYP